MNRKYIASLVVATLAAGAGTAVAAEAAVGTAAPTTGLIWIDWVIIAAYGIGTVVLGWWYSRGDRTTSEYFVGSGRMNPILIGVSLFATLLSTISYMSMPGEALGKGPAFLANYLAYPLIFAIVAFVLLPVYMKQRVQSAYELLEVRLGLSVRLLGASLFLVLRLVWMALMIYLTSKAISILMGVGEDWIPWIALVSGTVTIIYTSMGGLRAVVITDLMQTLLLYGGALLVIGTVSWKMGGFGWFPTEWKQNWDSQPFFSFDLSERVTVLGSIISVLLWTVATMGGDQLSVQRFMSTHDLKSARRALAVQLSISVIVGVTLSCVGFALLGYFEAFPERLGAGLSLKTDADKIFPRFIAFHLPPVVSGLVVAGLFAAAMSSLDSGVNSITAVVMRDFQGRFGWGPKTDEQHFRQARWLAFIIGAVVVASSSLMKNVPGNLTEVTGKTANLLTVPIFCLFVFALFVKFASPVGVWIGALCGVTVAALVAFSGPIFGMVDGRDPISFQWMQIGAFIANMVGGMAGSLLFPKGRKQLDASSDH